MSDTWQSLIVLVGTPGAGKSFWVDTYLRSLRMYDDPNNTKVFSTDAIREAVLDKYDGEYNRPIFEIAHLHTRKALEQGFDVIFDATSLTGSSRTALLALAPEGTRKIAVVFRTRFSLCMARVALRPEGALNCAIPEVQMLKFRNALEDTLHYIATEPWDEIVFTNGDGDAL